MTYFNSNTHRDIKIYRHIDFSAPVSESGFRPWLLKQSGLETFFSYIFCNFVLQLLKVDFHRKVLIFNKKKLNKKISGPSWSSSRDVRLLSSWTCCCLSPSHAIFFEASHWPCDHMIGSRPLIGQLSPPSPLPPTLPLQICIGPTIRIGRESWCLPYAGFF